MCVCLGRRGKVCVGVCECVASGKNVKKGQRADEDAQEAEI